MLILGPWVNSQNAVVDHVAYSGGLPGPHGGHALTGSRAQQPRARVGVPAEASAREVKRGGERGKLKVAGFLLHRQMV